MTVPGFDWIADRVDGINLVRGASLAFSVLVVGGLAAPLGSRIPVIGPLWLILVSLLAFVLAGYRIGSATDPKVHGAVTAVIGYLLVVPLVTMASGFLDVQQFVLTTLCAIVMGGLAGHLAGRNRTPRQV
ncbi:MULTISPECIES: hypothetical protein [unclassified Pseudonocardia]|uniref:hypothetical protein n=1 Tax=unclassified Pseudonocardia TaxID=2619320 RepID=UPI0001FFE7A3|nr:hypothetical protein [Pseudonocardia sp. Ae707_Ps1]OLM09258.1 hypothetical protein Ae707Ps1_6205 [Pseudonocardia sp. Ae707_Ps1]